MASKSSTPSNELQHAVEELRCTLGTIVGLAESNGHNAVHEIASAARVGLSRLDLILPAVQTPKENGVPCDYFRAQECLAGCPQVQCQESGACQKSFGHGFGGMLESVGP